MGPQGGVHSIKNKPFQASGCVHVRTLGDWSENEAPEPELHPTEALVTHVLRVSCRVESIISTAIYFDDKYGGLQRQPVI